MLVRDLVLVALLVVLGQGYATRTGSIAVARPDSSHSIERALDPDAALGRLEADGHARAHPVDGQVRLDADDGVVRPGHADVRDRRRAAALDARVGGLHVRVRAERPP